MEPGTQIVVVGEPTDLEVVIDLVSEDAVKVQPGNRCEITAWGGERPLAGRVRLVEPRVHQGVATGGRGTARERDRRF